MSITADKPAPKKRRNPWLWVSAVLGLVVIGLVIWALAGRSDLDTAQQELDSTQQELDSTQQELATAQEDLSNTSDKLESTTQELADTTQDLETQPTPTPEEDDNGRRPVLAVGAVATVKSLFDDLSNQLGATQDDLATTEQELEDANDKAEQADKDAKAAQQEAEQSDDAADKAQAETKQAEAEAEAARSKLTVAAGCFKAYLSAFGTLFDGDDIRAQAPGVREEFSKITADCKTALSGT